MNIKMIDAHNCTVSFLEKIQPIVLEKYPELLYESNWLRYPYHLNSGFTRNVYPDYRSGFRFGQRRKPFGRYPGGPGTSRGKIHTFSKLVNYFQLSFINL